MFIKHQIKIVVDTDASNSGSILIKLNEKEKSLSKKGSFHYTFDYKNHKKLEQEGLKFI